MLRAENSRNDAVALGARPPRAQPARPSSPALGGWPSAPAVECESVRRVAPSMSPLSPPIALKLNCFAVGAQSRFYYFCDVFLFAWQSAPLPSPAPVEARLERVWPKPGFHPSPSSPNRPDPQSLTMDGLVDAPCRGARPNATLELVVTWPPWPGGLICENLGMSSLMCARFSSPPLGQRRRETCPGPGNVGSPEALCQLVRARLCCPGKGFGLYIFRWWKSGGSRFRASQNNPVSSCANPFRAADSAGAVRITGDQKVESVVGREAVAGGPGFPGDEFSAEPGPGQRQDFCGC